MGKNVIRSFVLLLFYALIGFLALYAVIFTTGSRIPGHGATDYYHFSWSYWWVEHVITTPDTYLYETNYVIFPFTSNISYHTLAVFWFPLWKIASLFVGALGAFNAISWTAFTLTGYLCYLFLLREGVHPSLALLGGVVLEITPLMMLATWWTTPNLLGVFWYPTILLVWANIAEYRHWWVWAVLEGVLLWAALLTDMQYLLFLAFLLPPYALWTLARSNRRFTLITAGGIAIVVFLLLSWFVGPLKPMLEFEREKAVAAEGGLIWGIPFPEGYLGVPDYVRLYATGGFITAVVVITILFYLAVLLIKKNFADFKTLLWLGVMLPPLILSAGMEIEVGETTIKMPYAWLHEAMNGTFRAPGRFAPIFVFAALVFAGLVWTPTFKKYPRLGITLIPTLLVVLLANQHTLQSIETQPNPPIYEFYRMMAAEDENYVVVEVPVAVGDGIVTVGKPEDLDPMYYGSIHGKYMITGHFSRAYLEYYWYLRTDHPLLSWLGQRRDLDPNTVEPLLREMITSYPIGYFVIHQEAIGLESTVNQEIVGYFNQLNALLCPIAVEGDAVAYRTAWHPAGCPPRTPPQTAPDTYLVDIGGADDEKYLGWGWYWPEYPAGISWRWAGITPQADIFVDVPAGDYEIRMTAQSFWQPRTLQLEVNGVALEKVTLSTEYLNEVAFTVPAEVIGDGEHVRVRLLYDTPTIPAEVGQSADPRQLAIAVDWITFKRIAP